MKDIIREGHPTLAQRSEPVNLPLDEDTKQTLKDMMEFLENSQDPEKCEELELRAGVGLAAPQINISKRMLAVLTTDELGEKLYKLLLVNPKIISHSVKKVYIPGGLVSNDTGSIHSPEALEFLANINIDVSFLAASSVDAELNVCTPDDTKVLLKKYMIKHSPINVLIVDVSKFSQRAVHRIFNFSDVDYVVTDYTGKLEKE